MLAIVALVAFVVGLILVCVPDGRLFRIGTAIALVGIGIAVFLPAVVK